MVDLSGYSAIVTGGASGIGRAIVMGLIEAGAKVSYCDIKDGAIKGAHFTMLDVCDGNSLIEWYKSCGEVDILVNNVGISQFTPLTKIEVEEFDRVIATNLRPTFILSREMARIRNNTEGRKRYGRIVNIASTRHIQSEIASEAYAAAKGGITSLTHALALSFSEYNITVNSISPGWIDTGKYEISKADHTQHPSSRVGEVDDISRIVLFLCDPKNDFINGQDIVADGGMTKRMIYL